MGIPPVRATPMDGQRIRQPLPFGHARRELGGQFPPLPLVQLLRQRERDLTE